MSFKNIPTNWCVSTIGDINDYKSLTFNPKLHQEDEFELYSVPSFASGFPEVLLGKEIASNKQYIQFKDILLSKINPRINRVWCVKEKRDIPQIGSSEWIVIRQSLIHEGFLTYFLQTQSFRDLLCSDVSGVGGSLTRAQPRRVATYHVPIAPLQEQKIIAKKLDTLLAQVDSAKARLEQIPQILKRFRQAVLARAVNGSLTEGWREYKKINSPISTPLGMLIKSIDQGWSPKCENYSAKEHEWGVIKTSAVQSGTFISEGNKKLPTSLTPRLNLSLRKNDILITRAGPRSRCGITCIVEQDYPYLMICDKVYRVRVNQDRVRSDFLNWCLNSPQYLELIEGIKTGSSDSGMNLTQKKFLSFIISVPDILEQAEIVHRVEQLFAYADTIEKQVNSALDRVNNLTQSILAKAFRGELTAQWRAENPDLISGENSAAALLEKIKAERAASGSKKASRKKT